MLARFCLALGACAVLAAGPVWAQSVPRIKASVVAFEGNVLTVKPVGETDTMKIGVRPATRIMKEETRALSDLKGGDYAGATLSKNAMGVYEAQEVHVLPEALRGQGEGLYPATTGSSISVLTGTVVSINGAMASFKFRGASGEGAACTGRASVNNPLAGCQGSVTITVPAKAPVIALVPANKDDLKPGVLLAVSIMAGPDGKPVTPGVTIESLATPPVPLAVAPANASATAQAKFPSRGQKAPPSP